MHRYAFPFRVLVSLILALVLLPVILPVRASADFVLTTDIPMSVDTAHSASTNVTVTAVYGFVGTVVLTDAYSSGLTCGSLNPSSITGSGTAILSCHSSSPGVYNVTVTGVSGSITHYSRYSVNITATPRTAPNSEPATILGLSPPLFYGVIGTAITLAAASTYLRLRGRKTRAKPPV